MADEAAVAANPAAPATPAPGTAAAPVAADANKPAEGKAGEAEQKFKVKVNGKEQEVPLSELQKHYGTFQASQESLKKAAEQTKLAEDALSHVKQGTRDALRQAGLSDEQIRTIAIETLAEEHQKLQEEERKKGLSAEQRELEEARARLKEAKDEKDRLAKETHAAEVNRYKQAISGKVIETLDQFPESVRRNEMLANQVFHAWAYVLEHREEAQKLGIELTPAGIKAALVKRQRALVRELMVHDKDEELDEYLAPTVKGRLFKTQKTEAEKAAHPALTSQPASRGRQNGTPAAPTKARNKLIRELTLGVRGGR